jgi:hypothetical protein
LKNGISVPTEITRSKPESGNTAVDSGMSPWKSYQLRLAQTENLFQNQDNQEQSTQKGSLELYWRAGQNRIRRQQAIVALRAKEAEYLNAAAQTMSVQLESAVPPRFRVAMASQLESEVEVHKKWLTVSESNMRLLADLGQVESGCNMANKTHWLSAAACENAEAAACVIQLESALFEDKCSHWPVYLNDTLQQCWSAIGLLKSQMDANTLEIKIAEATRDLEKITEYMQEIKALSDLSGADRGTDVDEEFRFSQISSEVNELVGICYAIAAKHVGPGSLQNSDRTVS